MIDLKSMTRESVIDFIKSTGQPEYRGKQVWEWLVRGEDIDGMTNIPLPFREKLKKLAYITRLKTTRKLSSKTDGTVKYLFELSDGEKIETVFMEYRHGNTVCISTQVGCRMGCRFCASAVNGYVRDLTAGEMIEQICEAERDLKKKVSNIVLMGIGEPLDNYDNVLNFLKIINDGSGYNIGMRHISLSTCGLCDMIKKLASENLQLTLSVSLHAPNDEIRRKTMPVAGKFSMDELISACDEYAKITKRRISYEYALIAGENDSEANAHELGKRLTGKLCHVNLIPVNAIKEKNYKRSEKIVANNFTKILESYRITVTTRRALGLDIEAACGQLRAEHINT